MKLDFLALRFVRPVRTGSVGLFARSLRVGAFRPAFRSIAWKPVVPMKPFKPFRPFSKLLLANAIVFAPAVDVGTDNEKSAEDKSTDDDYDDKSTDNDTSPTPSFFYTHIFSPVATVFRFLHLLLLFTPVLLTLPLLFIGPRKQYGITGPDKLSTSESAARVGARLWYNYLAWTMQCAGPSFVKLGQWAASRTDIFPELLTTRLAHLHSDARPHAFAMTQRTVAEALSAQGLAMDDVFLEFGHEPIGVGAIAQVYKAKLRPGVVENGDGAALPVAVKVLHPHVAATVERDISIMMFFARVLNALPSMEWLSLPGEVQTFAEMMRQQMDLRVEANNLAVFRKNFAPKESHRSSSFQEIVFPKPYPQCSSRKVLVEEFISAVPMTEILKNSSGDGRNKMERLVSSKGLDAFLKMLLLDNFVHADLHPGNIFVRFYKKDWVEEEEESRHVIGDVEIKLPTLYFARPHKGVDPRIEQITQQMRSLSGDQAAWQKFMEDLLREGYQPQLCFIDVGLVTQLSDTNRRNFLDLFKAIAAFDGYRVGELMIERSRTPETAIDADFFALKTQRLVNNIRERTFALGNVRVGDLLATMLGMVRGHHVRMEPDFVTVVLSILLLEGIGRQLDPQMDLFKSSLPVLRQLGAMERRGTLAVLGSNQDMLSMIKVWLALETRQFISASIQDIHNCVKYDFLSPNR